METKTKVIIAVSTLGLGAIGFLVWKFVKESKLPNKSDMKEAGSANELPFDVPEVKVAPKQISTVKSSSTFPLKMGSRGQLVKDIQNALIKKYGASVLPKYGADGDYGMELFTTLQAKKLPTWIDSLAYAKIISINTGVVKEEDDTKVNKDGKNEVYTPIRIANYLHKAVDNSNVFYALDALKKIKNTKQFMAVSTEFKKDMTGFFYKGIVDALMDEFDNSEYRKKIGDQFQRIGLKFDGKRWSV